MRWLSAGSERLVERLKKEGSYKPLYDFAVIGSGYGGAVTACRLAEAGFSVCVLERGNEYGPGEFPNDMAQLPGHVRIERADRPGVIGNKNSLFDVRLHGTVTTLVGNALGGTSQINANVALRADPELFREDCWPEPLRKHYDPLDPYYTRVEQMLGVTPYPHPCTKASELKRLEAPLNQLLAERYWKGEIKPQARCYNPPLAVNHRPSGPNAHDVKQNPCTGCGDCVTGCNVGAKNTLTMNYLPVARRHGAEIYTGVNVMTVEPIGNVMEIRFLHTDREWEMAWSADPVKAWAGDKDPTIPLRTRYAILAAGAIGSSEILLRSRYAKNLRLSPRLGTRFSGNGDALHFGFDQDRRVNAVGYGCDFAKHEKDPQEDWPGPSIVSVLDVRTGLPTRDGVLIQDGIMPGAIAHLTHEVLSVVSIMTQLEEPSLKREGCGSDPLAFSTAARDRTQVYLGVGHDSSEGTIELKHGRGFVRWPDAASNPWSARQEEYLGLAKSALGATFMPNPSAQPLPSAMRSALSGPQPSGTAIVVHPLGGCPMGDDFWSGVVDDLGAVYNGKDPETTYKRLYVCDGSIIPGSIGVNPFLTIAALAERTAEALIRSAKPEIIQPPAELPEGLPYCDPYTRGERPEKVAFRWHETMKGRMLDCVSKKNARVELCLRLEMPDLIGLVADPRHRVGDGAGAVHGSLKLEDGSRNLSLKVNSQASIVELLVPVPEFRFFRMRRALCTWWEKRGRDELCRMLPRIFRGSGIPGDIGAFVKTMPRLAGHIGEKRLMSYAIALVDETRDPPRPYTLRGRKTIDYADGQNLWHSLLDLDSTLTEEATGIRWSGKLRLDLTSLAEHDFPGIVQQSELPNGLLALGSLFGFFLRVMVKAHLWSLRAPDYPPRIQRSPVPDQQPLFIERVRNPFDSTRWLYPTRHWFTVNAGIRNDEDRAKETIPLALTRFERLDAAEKKHATPILLLHGFAQSSYAFVVEREADDLVRSLLRQGFEVWLLDYRTSTALPSSRQQCLLDDVARYDLPDAVRKVLELTNKKNLAIFGHCMGSATAAMSLLAGQLREKVHSVVFSQVPLLITPGEYSRSRRQLAAFLRDAIGISAFNLRADDGASAWEIMADRLLATFPMQPREYCPHEQHRCQPRTEIATCKRISGIIGPLYQHAQVKGTHARMNQYFGWGSISVFAQIAKFFEYERLVTAAGSNAYVTEANVAEELRGIRVCLLHGELNQVFDIKSAERTEELLQRVNPASKCVVLKIPGYAHFDCLVGDRAAEDVYRPLAQRFLSEVP